MYVNQGILGQTKWLANLGECTLSVLIVKFVGFSWYSDCQRHNDK